MSVSRRASFTVQDLVPRMTTDLGYKPAVAERIATRLVTADEPVKAAFWRWWTTGEIDQQLEVEGYTIERLIKEKKLPPPTAFSTLTWLQRDPQEALRTLGRGRELPPRFRSVPSV